MENDIIKEICEDLKWYERIIVKLLKKLFISAYRKGLIRCFNYYNK